MSAPQGGYPPPGADAYGPGAHPQYDGQQQHPGYEHAGSPDPAGAPQPATQAGGRKKRAYAGQAFEYGTGANAALGGQNAGIAGYSGAAGAAPWGGYPSQPQQPGYGAEQTPGSPPAPMYPQQQPAPYGGVGGYQAPDQGYPAQPTPPGVGGITSQFGQMNMGGPQPPLVQHIPQRAQPLNQLFPTDLASQPFQVSELDLPPPPIILPQNVGHP